MLNLYSKNKKTTLSSTYVFIGNRPDGLVKSAFGDGSSANVFVGNRPDGLAQRPILEGPRAQIPYCIIADLGDSELWRLLRLYPTTRTPAQTLHSRAHPQD